MPDKDKKIFVYEDRGEQTRVFYAPELLPGHDDKKTEVVTRRSGVLGTAASDKLDWIKDIFSDARVVKIEVDADSVAITLTRRYEWKGPFRKELSDSVVNILADTLGYSREQTELMNMDGWGAFRDRHPSASLITEVPSAGELAAAN